MNVNYRPSLWTLPLFSIPEGKPFGKGKAQKTRREDVELQYILEKEKKEERFESQSDIVKLRHKTKRKAASNLMNSITQDMK
ncbi:MAG: hypothetical protein IJE08_00745, partial [Clostridia bacterium]|nr:hypothetical protein [Clostridia bacterium]